MTLSTRELYLVEEYLYYFLKGLRSLYCNYYCLHKLGIIGLDQRNNSA